MIATPLDPIVAEFGVDHAILCGPRGPSEVAYIRFAAYYVLRRRGMTLQAIGALLGGRDHSTVVHGLKMAQKRMVEDAAYCDHILALVGDRRAA